METKDILAEIRCLYNHIFDSTASTDNHAISMHNTSTADIKTNGGGVDDLGSVVSDLAESIDELASTISALDERLTKLEGEKS